MTALLAFRPRHRPGGWSPKELGTLSLWLDADDATTITLSTGVSQWDDKSGAARNLTQSTGSQQPTYERGAQNGRAVVRFANASNQYLTGGDVLDLGTGGISVAIAYKQATNTQLICKTASGVNAAGEWALAQGTGQYYTTTSSAATGTDSFNTWNCNSWVVDRSASNTLWRNGTQLATTASGTPNSTNFNTTSPFYVGARYITTSPNYDQPLGGDIAEIVISLATWSTGDRQSVEGYLAHKWGLVSSLPSDHPYKSVAP